MKKHLFRLLMILAILTTIAVSSLGTYSTWKLLLKETPVKYSLAITFYIAAGFAVGVFLAICFGYVLVQLTDKLRIFTDRNFPSGKTVRQPDKGAEWIRQNGGAETPKPARTSCQGRPWRKQNHANRMHLKLGD